MRIQAPPNLVDLTECTALLGAGVDDWGGVSPLTPDHVNPERPWPSLDRLRSVTEAAGFDLRERLTAHPEYVRAGEPWIDPRVSAHVAALADEVGLARDGVRPTGLPWQEPDGGFVASGRTDLHASIDTEGRTADRRDDFDSVYGDWDELRGQVDLTAGGFETSLRSSSTTGALRSSSTTGATGIDPDVKAALRSAERDPAGLSDEQALAVDDRRRRRARRGLRDRGRAAP